MKPLSDARFAFMTDPDLYDLVGRLALRIVRDEAFAEDIRNGAFEVAMLLVCRGRTPKPGMERGWMCRVTRNHTYAEIRRRKKEEEPPLKDDEMPDLPVEHHQALWEEQQRCEKLLDAAEQLAETHPEQVAQLVVADGRTKEGAAAGPMAPADRKRKERARTTLASVIIAAIAAAIVLLFVRRVPQPVPGLPVLPTGAYATLADASHELAHRSCAAQKWAACLEGLEQLRALDPSKLGPAEEGAKKAAIAGLRQEALAECTAHHLMACLQGLDTARTYDPEGDKDSSVMLARTEAWKSLGGSAPVPFPLPDAKGGIPGRHR